MKGRYKMRKVKIASVIHLDDEIKNEKTSKSPGAEADFYFPCSVKGTFKGKEIDTTAFFTENQLSIALSRAEKHHERHFLKEMGRMERMVKGK